LTGFSSATIQELIKAHRFNEHAELSQFEMRFHLPDTDNGQGVSKRETAIMRYLVDHPDAKGPLGTPLVGEILERFLSERRSRSSGRHALAEALEDVPTLASCLQSDGWQVHENSLIRADTPHDDETPIASMESAMARGPIRQRLQGIQREDVSVVKRSGGECNGVPAYFLPDGDREIVIVCREISQPVEDGDVIVRYLPSGLRERYQVQDPGYTQQTGVAPTETFPEHYEIRYKRMSTLEEQKEPSVHQERGMNQAKDPRSVFVVHGRNGVLRDAMFQFLRAIGLSPIEWSKAKRATKKPSPYVKEILDAAFKMAQAAVVLLTPDDYAYLRPDLQQPGDGPHETNPTLQARPNVLFEAGMAVAWEPDRTIIVEVGNLRPFTDIAGIHVIRLNNSADRRLDLADALETAGCQVNKTDRDWLTAGNFEIAEPPPTKSQEEATGNIGISVGDPVLPRQFTEESMRNW
jgi:predicted nucleotide-binding protein